MLYECLHCEKSYSRADSLARHVKQHHPSIPMQCYICKRAFYRKNGLNDHLKNSHNIIMHDYEHEPLMTAPPLVRGRSLPPLMDNNLPVSPNYSTWNKKPNDTYRATHGSTGTKPYCFKHPFSMIVAGPSRSGKTHWVIKLLIKKQRRIFPEPDQIVYCYAHWQKTYSILQRENPAVRWHEGLPSTVFMNNLTDTVVVVDDLMSAGMKDPALMSMFTEGSHHKNLSVIFLVQNLFHQGRQSRSINLNTQYLVLFKNPRDRQQIQTLARQMYPNNWRKFLEYFEYETSKPYGKVIIDLNPETLEKDRFVADEEEEGDVNKLYTQQVQQQKRLLEYTDPYIAQAQKTQERMQTLQQNSSLTDEQKKDRYDDMLDDYKMYMKNAKKVTPIVQPIVHPIAQSVVLSNVRVC